MICTFYSYKGGVGRSMAMAGVTDTLARAGARVLMTDFDLEAPGIEQYFTIDQAAVQANLGIFDLVQRYKRAMSNNAAPGAAEAKFRRIEDFVFPVYPELPSGGRLDLMPAGQRGSDEQLAQYALDLRQFDWQDFYFNWGGEFFFEWLRRELTRALYDIVLVDSRTGVTEMGGICAYQLADIVVMMCAPNRQNLEGTFSVVKNFTSPRVRMLRLDRELRVLVIPARVEVGDAKHLEAFRSRFDALFEPFTPAELREQGITLWDLLIPYDPAQAFDEQIASAPLLRREPSGIWQATQRLTRALVTLFAAADTMEGKSGKTLQLAPRIVGAETIGTAFPQYDVTQRFAGYDAFVDCTPVDRRAVRELVDQLTAAGLAVWFEIKEVSSGADGSIAQIRQAIQQSRTYVVCVGPGGEYPWTSEYQRVQLELAASQGVGIIPVLLPGAELPEAARMPLWLAGVHWLRVERLDRDAGDELRRAIEVAAELPSAQPRGLLAEQGTRLPDSRWSETAPFRGLQSFREEDAEIFFGREELVGHLVHRLRNARFMAVAGMSGIGKTSVINAGLIPRLRQGALSGSARWHYLVMRPGSDPLQSLVRAFRGIADVPQFGEATWDEVAHWLSGSSRIEHVLLIIDQLEEVFAPDVRHASAPLFRTLLEIVNDRSLPISIVAVLRSDFIQEISQFTGIARLVEDNLVFVAPPSLGELREIIASPARVAGLAFEPGLVDRILSDVADEPGALPLLQFVLRALWERRRRGFLTVAAYDEMSGVDGALGRAAEQVYQDLDSSEAQLARRIFVSLVRAEGGTIVRRRARLRALGGLEIRRLVDLLADRRLVVLDVDGAEETIELAHEALIRAWPRFAEWVDEERAFLVWRTRAEESAAEWRSRAEDSMELLAGRHLDEAREWLAVRGADVPEALRDYIFASIAVDDARRSAERRRRRRVLSVSTSGLVVALVLAGLAGWQWRIAEQQRRIVNEQAAIAKQQTQLAQHSLSLATQAVNVLVLDLAKKFRTAGLPAALVADILAEARKLQDQLAANGDTNPDLRRSQAAALAETVTTLLTTGDTAGALAAAKQGREISQSLAASYPSDPDYQHSLAISNERIGDVLEVQGDLAGTLAAYREALVLLQLLVRKDPGNSQWQGDFAVSDNRIGDVLAAQGDLAGALAAHREALALLQALVQKDPGNLQWQSDLPVSDNRIGDILAAQGDLAGALVAYREALAILQALAQKDPGNTQWQRDLAVSGNNIGDALTARGDLVGALAQYRDALAIREVLAQRDPSNTQLQSDLAVSVNKIGDVLAAQGDLAGALAQYRDALEIEKALAQRDPSNAQWQRDLSTSDEKLGDVLIAQGNLPEALATYRDSLAIRERLAKADPANAGWQRDLSVSYNKVGDVLIAQGNLPDALAAYRDSLAIRDRLAQRDPSNAQWQRDLSTSDEKLGDVLISEGNLPDALATYRDSLAIRESLAKADPGNAGWQRDLSTSHEKLGDVLIAQGNLPGASAPGCSNGIRTCASVLARAASAGSPMRSTAWISSTRIGSAT